MANEGYPHADELKDQDRRHQAGRMEGEAQIRSVFGSPEEREHERLRVGQEWDKIEHDKAQGKGENDVWHGHLKRMRRMALSIKNPEKAARRSKHLELAGLLSASRYFQQRAEALCDEAKKPVDVQKDILLSNLNKFNDFTGECL